MTLREARAHQSLAAFVRDDLQPHILPVYRVPFAAARSDNGPRYVHGCVHICRSLVFAEALVAAWSALLRREECDRFAIRHAIAWHDAGRQDDGEDWWEEDSARLATRYLLERYGIERDSHEEGYARYVGRLVVKPGDLADPNVVVVTGVDSLDIMRLTGRRGFDLDMFPWLDPCPSHLERERARLVDEAGAWIHETEHWIRRRDLDADAACFDTLAAHLLARGDCYPRLAEPLRAALELE